MHLKLRYAVLTGAVCLLFVGAAFAQDVNRQELTNFDRFLDSHPAIHKDLQNNPALVKDSNYLSAHPELKKFLDSHPGVREEIRENPKGFVNRERTFEKNGKDVTGAELKNFDGFLDNHPAVGKDLRKNPSLVNNEDYLEKHPELREFLNNHPQVRQDLREHPGAFMHREKKFDKHEQNQTKADRREDQKEIDAERREERREQQPQRFLEHQGGKH